MDRYNERLVPGRPGSEARLVFGVGIVLILAAVVLLNGKPGEEKGEERTP